MSDASRMALLVGMTLLVLACCPWMGPELAGPKAAFVFWELRVPRVLMGALVGASLGVSGAAVQALLHNPLASPSTLGTTAGASLGALVAILTFGNASLWGLSAVTVSAFLGAGVVSLMLVGLAVQGRARTEDILLLGVGIALAASAITMGLHLRADLLETTQAVRWALGSLAQVGYRGVTLTGPILVACTLVLCSLARPLETLIGGEDRARTQGVDVSQLRLVILLAVSLSVGTAVAWCGPIGFVGLVVPHLVRLGWTARRRVLLPASALLGSALLTLCDAGARAAGDIPVGVVTSAIGAPMLIWLILRRRTPDA